MSHSYSSGRVIDSELESITWLPKRGIKTSVQSLGGYELEQAWRIGYHTLRTLVGCRNPIEWPTLRLWQGYETALANYLWHCLQEMDVRRFPEDLEHQFFYAIISDGPRIQSGRVSIHLKLINARTLTLQSENLLPEWFGWNPLHRSHRIALQTGDLTQIRWPWERSAHAPVRTAVRQAG